MIINRTEPVGIDVSIGRIQEGIESFLVGLWSQVDVYGRVYLKQTEEAPTVEAYYKDGEYRLVTNSEGNKVFFIQDDTSTNIGGNLFRSDVWVVAILDLEKAKLGFEQRADEAARQDLLMAISREVRSDKIESILTGVDNLKRISGSLFEDDAFKFTDIHPYHVFMVKMNINFNYKC